MNISNLMRVLVVLLCLGGLWSVFGSVEPVGSRDAWDGCISDGFLEPEYCYQTWRVAGFDTGLPLVVKVYGDDEVSLDVFVSIFELESDLFKII